MHNQQRDAILLMIEDEWQQLINSGLTAQFTDLISITVLHDFCSIEKTRW